MVRKAPLGWGLQVFAWLLLVWLVLDGAGGVVGLAVGALAAALGAWLGARLAPAEPHGWRPGALLRFSTYFLVESLRGAVDVAWRALHPALPIEPHLATHPIALPPGKPRTLLVSVVSLLPGTLSADLSASGDELRVHALSIAARAGVRDLEQRIARLFGLPLVRAGARDDESGPRPDAGPGRAPRTSPATAPPRAVREEDR